MMQHDQDNWADAPLGDRAQPKLQRYAGQLGREHPEALAGGDRFPIHLAGGAADSLSDDFAGDEKSEGESPTVTASTGYCLLVHSTALAIAGSAAFPAHYVTACLS
jgi:hypothetical protein